MVKTDRWLHRRRMAWSALLAGLLFPLLLLWSQSDQLGAVAGAFYVFVGMVVSAYIGFATHDDIKMRGKDDSGT
jgi:di/tricarboxylate transporter